jgi:DNA-binding transcriptional ArsR family regulator
VDVFDVVADPTRRRILEIMLGGEMAVGEIADVIRGESGISAPAVSQHLGVLREHGFVTVRADRQRRLYSLRPEAFDEIHVWLELFRLDIAQKLDALGTEIARGARARRRDQPARKREIS